jgi:hypothetical protein
MVPAGQAVVNITWNSMNGELPDLVQYDSSDEDIRRTVQECIRTGYIPGIAADPNADIRDFVIDRIAATDIRPYSLLMVRPKTPFGRR